MLLRPWIILAALTLARIAFGYQFQTVATIATDMVARFDLSYAQLGGLIGAYNLLGVVAALPLGLLARRFGDRWLLGGGLLLMTVGAGFSAWAPTAFGIGEGPRGGRPRRGRRQRVAGQGDRRTVRGAAVHDRPQHPDLRLPDRARAGSVGLAASPAGLRPASRAADGCSPGGAGAGAVRRKLPRACGCHRHATRFFAAEGRAGVPAGDDRGRDLDSVYGGVLGLRIVFAEQSGGTRVRSGCDRAG